MMPKDLSPDGDSSKVEIELQERVVRARERYERALAMTRSLGCESGDGDQSVSGSPNIVRALRIQQGATRHYSEALRELSEFVFDYLRKNCA